jgi:hypothetical protein
MEKNEKKMKETRRGGTVVSATRVCSSNHANAYRVRVPCQKRNEEKKQKEKKKESRLLDCH